MILVVRLFHVPHGPRKQCLCFRVLGQQSCENARELALRAWAGGGGCHPEVSIICGRRMGNNVIIVIPSYRSTRRYLNNQPLGKSARVVDAPAFSALHITWYTFWSNILFVPRYLLNITFIWTCLHLLYHRHSQCGVIMCHSIQIPLTTWLKFKTT